MGRWKDADREFSNLAESSEKGASATSCKVLSRLYFNRRDVPSRQVRELIQSALSTGGQNQATLAIVATLGVPQGTKAGDAVDYQTNSTQVKPAFVIYRMGRFEEARGIFQTCVPTTPIMAE